MRQSNLLVASYMSEWAVHAGVRGRTTVKLIIRARWPPPPVLTPRRRVSGFHVIRRVIATFQRRLYLLFNVRSWRRSGQRKLSFGSTYPDLQLLADCPNPIESWQATPWSYTKSHPSISPDMSTNLSLALLAALRVGQMKDQGYHHPRILGSPTLCADQ